MKVLEESKTLLNIPEDSKKLHVKTKIVSRSLPSSPARYFSRKGSMEIDHSSDSEEKSSISESNNISTFSSKIFSNLDLETTNLNTENGIELSTMSVEHSEEKGIYSPNPKPMEYFKNAYMGEKDTSKNLFSVHKYHHTFLALKNLLAQLPLSHGFLLLSIIVHNSKTFSSYYLDYIFDGFIAAYVIYTLLCIVIQIPTEKLPPHVTYDDTQLEMTSIHQSVADKTMKGSVKILKGDYDPDEQRQHMAELVNICIENQCLKISRIPKNNECDENATTPFEIYDLSGADISLVPKDLSKRRAFRKKFPICIKLPLSSKNYQTINDSYDMDQEGRCDYVSLFPYQDGLIETPKRQALYIFALTDREKETWFYALKKCIVLEELNATEYSTLYSSSPKLDMTSISYSSLMEINSEETLSVTEDSSGISAELNFIQSKTKPTLEFEDYVKTLFENYFRDINTSEHSWKPEIFSDANRKKDISSTVRHVEWVNVALGRLFYDFLTQKYWSERIMEKIQKKLNNLEMPSFVETLEVTDVFMGTCIPQLHSVSNVVVDEFGIWLDFDFTYNGSFQMTLQTKLKMPKTKHQMQSDEHPDNSDLKQSAEVNESSDDDGKSPKQNKLINKLEKWISHKHFQTVAQSRFVKKYVGDISNMLLTLTVEVNLLQGILAVNIPPVPTDRVWYGFRKDPILNITASPKVGSHEINLSAVVKMIEQRLIRAFKKAIVMPHMDDLIIPLMFSSAYEE
ncbi:Testis-expressed protein 2 like protein [Argiope bruennichi]|uniref:Testis-expressed protein 2 like protein n=1 Tax=Argiope bruennichi TaxID=94029 RepID=A0A8T0EK49_ARGBR|nr:Testis-expressed protein 2 like protein [Argiope bruennichi]